MTAKNNGKKWTKQDDTQLKKLAEENTPTRIIGLKMGRTPEAIQTMASKKKISLKPTNQRPYGTKKKKN